MSSQKPKIYRIASPTYVNLMLETNRPQMKLVKE